MHPLRSAGRARLRCAAVGAVLGAIGAALGPLAGAVAASPAGPVVAWGDDSYGQTGGVPLKAVFMAVDGGGYHSVALRSNGSIASWGRNTDGQVSQTPAGTGFTAVAAGGDRQDLHERIRVHSQAAAAEVKQHGRANDLLERLAKDKAFAGVDLNAAVDPRTLTGRSAEQVDEFLTEVVEPVRKRYTNNASSAAEVRV